MKRSKRLKSKKTKSMKSIKVTPHFGLAWFKKEDWTRLLDISENRENMEEDYDEWVQNAESSIKDYGQKGIKIQKVEIDLNELVAWCNKKNVKINGEARASFAAYKLQQKGKDGV